MPADEASVSPPLLVVVDSLPAFSAACVVGARLGVVVVVVVAVLELSSLAAVCSSPLIGVVSFSCSVNSCADLVVWVCSCCCDDGAALVSNETVDGDS